MKRGTDRSGFTIVEVLVVIGIIGVIVGLMLPALAGARNSSRKLNEVNAVRQFYMAWSQYGTHHRDQAIPGYLGWEETGGYNVQDLMHVDYEFPDGTQMTARIAAPYTWRLLPYLDHDHDLVHGYRNENDASVQSMIEHAEDVAYEPAFGYNGLYVGGYFEMVRTCNVPQHVTRYNEFRGDERKFNQVARSITHVRPDQIVFASSSRFEPGTYKTYDSDTAGHFLVNPPRLADEMVWAQGGEAGESTGLAATGLDPTALNVLSRTSPPIGRHTGAAVTVRGDGSAGAATPGSLLDQRLWQHRANASDYTHPEGYIAGWDLVENPGDTGG